MCENPDHLDSDSDSDSQFHLDIPSSASKPPPVEVCQSASSAILKAIGKKKDTADTPATPKSDGGGAGVKSGGGDLEGHDSNPSSIKGRGTPGTESRAAEEDAKWENLIGIFGHMIRERRDLRREDLVWDSYSPALVVRPQHYYKLNPLVTPGPEEHGSVVLQYLPVPLTPLNRSYEYKKLTERQSGHNVKPYNHPKRPRRPRASGGKGSSGPGPPVSATRKDKGKEKEVGEEGGEGDPLQWSASYLASVKEATKNKRGKVSRERWDRRWEACIEFAQLYLDNIIERERMKVEQEEKEKQDQELDEQCKRSRSPEECKQEGTLTLDHSQADVEESRSSVKWEGDKGAWEEERVKEDNDRGDRREMKRLVHGKTKKRLAPGDRIFYWSDMHRAGDRAAQRRATVLEVLSFQEARSQGVQRLQLDNHEYVADDKPILREYRLLRGNLEKCLDKEFTRVTDFNLVLGKVPEKDMVCPQQEALMASIDALKEDMEQQGAGWLMREEEQEKRLREEKGGGKR